MYWDANTKVSRTGHLTYKPDLDLEPVWSERGFCTSPPWREYLTQVSSKSYNLFWRYGADTILNGRTDRQIYIKDKKNIPYIQGETTRFGDMKRTRFLDGQTDERTDGQTDIHPGQKKYLLYTGGDIIVKSTLINFSCASLLKLKLIS